MKKKSFADLVAINWRKPAKKKGRASKKPLAGYNSSKARVQQLDFYARHGAERRKLYRLRWKLKREGKEPPSLTPTKKAKPEPPAKKSEEPDLRKQYEDEVERIRQHLGPAEAALYSYRDFLKAEGIL